MKRLALTVAIGLLLGGVATQLHAQAAPTASRTGSLQVGAGYSVAGPDYGQKYIEGISVYADLDLTYHIGVEAVAHKVSYFTPLDIGEDSYLIGPRYVFHYKRLDPYAKIVFGYGVFQTQYDNRPHTSTGYGVYGGGGGVDIRATPHVNIRAIDFEYQKWPGFGSGLTPYVTTFGAAYVF